MWINEIHEDTKKIQNIAGRLFDLSYCLVIAGNDKLSMDLEDIADELKMIEESISAIVSKKVNDDYKTAEQSAWNTVAAALLISDKET